MYAKVRRELLNATHSLHLGCKVWLVLMRSEQCTTKRSGVQEHTRSQMCTLCVCLSFGLSK